MSMIRDLAYWWNVDRPRAKAKRIRLKAERELAAVAAKELLLVQLHNQCKTFKFADDLLAARADMARLKKLIEQTEAYLKSE